jgi:beta-galactosidase
MSLQNGLKKLAVAIIAVTVMGAASTFAVTFAPTVRKIVVINKNWKFVKQDVSGAQAVSYPGESSMSSVNLPHSFEIPYWRTNYAVAPFIGWYRKHITIDQSVLLNKKRVFLEFEGAFRLTTVYVNGQSMGLHSGGYTGFNYDITPQLVVGDNVIAARVDASWYAQVAPRAGEHIFSGGIYRDVYLVMTDPLHVTWCGTFVSTKQAAPSSASLKISTEVQNSGDTVKSCMVKSTIVDSSGAAVATVSTTQNVAVGAVDTIVQSSVVASPLLWSPTAPSTYTLITQVYNGSSLVDDYATQFGIRTVRWDKDSGVFINNKHVWLQGANVHQDHAGWCDATTNSGSYRDVKLIRDCGMNFIRGSHYPHDPAFYDAADRLGVCLWSELPYWGIGGFTSTDPTGTAYWNASAYPYVTADQAPFEQNVLQQESEMIRIYRNHPSVIVWSMGNEIEFSNTAVLPNAKNLVTRMVAASHLADSTRPAALGGTWNDFQSLADVNGYNGGQTTVINPGIPNMVSEYGSCQQDRPGTYDGCYIGAYGNLQVQNNLPVQYAWRSGVCLWSGFHHGSNATLGNTGMIDHARLPLRRYYFYRNIYAGIAPPDTAIAGTAAQLKLTTDSDTITDDGRSDCQLIVQVQDASGKRISNSPNITLTDASGLGMFPTGSSITFTGGAKDKGVLDGMAAIEFRSYNAGTITITASSAGLTSSSVTVIAKHVADPDLSVAVRPAAAAQTAKQPISFVTKNIGTSIELPAGFSGRKTRVSVYNLQGRLVTSFFSKGKAGALKIPLEMDGMWIVKAFAEQ